MSCWWRQGLNADVQSYQAAISERLGSFIHNLFMFGAGIGVGELIILLLLSTHRPRRACTVICQPESKRCHAIAAFWRGWDLALVVLATLPVLVVASAVIGVFLGRMQNKAAAAYAAAGSLTLEALSNIRSVPMDYHCLPEGGADCRLKYSRCSLSRTVAAYGQEETTVRAYTKSLEKTLQVSTPAQECCGPQTINKSATLWCGR